MTLKEQVQADGVAMRWVRTAATTITSVAAALAVIWASVIYFVGPRVVDWAVDLIDTATADLQRENAQTQGQIERLDAVVVKLEGGIAALSEAVARSTSPSWRFSLPDTSISDGEIGGRVRITAGGWKLRECGIPRVDLYFRNGGGVYHRFIDASLLSVDQRGIAAPVDPDRLQVISYTATIPPDDNVSPGRAVGYISVTYPDACPEVEEVVAGPLQFRIKS